MSENIPRRTVQYKNYLIHISVTHAQKGWLSHSFITELGTTAELARLPDSAWCKTEDDSELHAVQLGMEWIDKQQSKNTSTSAPEELYAVAPGDYIALETRDGWKLELSIGMLANHFSDAHLAQVLFEEAWARQQSVVHFSQAYNRAAREKRMYAREFVFSLDSFTRELQKMTEERRAPAQIKAELDDFNARVPDIVNVRNNLHHPEDRIRGRKQGGQPIKIQPIDAYGIKSEGGGQLFINMFYGSKFGGTAADGRLVVVDVSVKTLYEMARTLQHVIDAFPWYTFFEPRRYPDDEW
jgi:hypothetical protein